MSGLTPSGLKTKKQGEFDRHWQGTPSDYVTAIAWSPTGNLMAASSAAGEVALYQARVWQETPVQTGNGYSVDCLAFSHDGQFLAAGGQNGRVNIWRVQSDLPELIATVRNTAAWVDRMAWSPTQNLLAFSLGKYVQVWDAASGDIATTLDFDTSSALDLTWHPAGKRLSVGGYQGVKIWTAADWIEPSLCWNGTTLLQKRFLRQQRQRNRFCPGSCTVFLVKSVNLPGQMC